MLANRTLQAASSGAGYQIQRSLRFRSAASAYLSRTPVSAGNRKTWTFSCWVKKSDITSQQFLLAVLPISIDAIDIYLGALRFYLDGGNGAYVVTTQLFRDPSAHFHLVAVLDTTNGTASDRLRIYVNGVRVTSFSTNTQPVLDYQSKVNTTGAHYIGQSGTSSAYLDGYISEVNFVDGQALDATSFGQTDPVTGVWSAKRYTGTYGSNGFYLSFSDPTTTTLLGYDRRSGAYSRNLRLSGTAIGGYTANGGLAAAFDANTNQPNASSAKAISPVAGYTAASAIGRDWGVGVTKTITAFRIFGQNDGGMVGGTTQTTNYKLQGSNDGTNYTDLMSPGTTTGATSEIVTVTSGITTSTAYRYHRVIFNANGADNYYVCELELYESGTYAIGPNDWTLNNISVTTGTTYDSMLDVPLGSGGSERGNYCTLNPISTSVASYVKEAGLSLSGNSTGQYPGVGGTMYVSTGKWYWEYVAVAGGTLNCTFGFSPQLAFGGTFQTATGAVGYTNDTGAITVSGGTVTTGASFTSGDIIGVALDCGAGTAQFYKNNSATGALVTGLTGAYTPAMNLNYYPSNTIYLNCGQRPFTYTPPTGFLALHTGNFSVPTIRKPNQYFDASLFTGNGTSQSIVNSGAFQPDFVWLKSRNNARSHALYDSVRGRALGLLTDGTSAEYTSSAGNDLVSFNSSGFSVGVP